MASPARRAPLREGMPELWLELSRLDGNRLEAWTSPETTLADLSEGRPPGVPIDSVEVSARIAEDDGGVPRVELFGSGGSSLRGRLRSKRPAVAARDLFGRIDRVVNLSAVVPDAETALALVGEARRAGMLEHLWLVSADLAVLQAVRSDSPATRLLHSCDPTKQPHGPERHAATLREAAIEGVMVRHDVASAGLVALMDRFGCILGAHGAEYARMVRACLAAGAAIVCGPSPDAFAQVQDPF